METAPARKTVRVTIYNQPYTLASGEETGEIESLAHEVDEIMTSIAQRAGNVDSQRVAVLACLHLADKVRMMERQLGRLDSKAREFSILLDRAIE
jgi:cell division protein ZapA